MPTPACFSQSSLRKSRVEFPAQRRWELLGCVQKQDEAAERPTEAFGRSGTLQPRIPLAFKRQQTIGPGRRGAQLRLVSFTHPAQPDLVPRHNIRSYPPTHIPPLRLPPRSAITLASRTRSKSLPPPVSRTNSFENLKLLANTPPRFENLDKPHPRRPGFPHFYLFSILIALALLAVQLPWPDLQLRSPLVTTPSSQQPLSAPRPQRNPFTQDSICIVPPDPPSSGSLYNTAPRDMALAREAQKVAAEFEYSAKDVNNGVKEFIRQMHEGLGKSGAQMSQIPTYVTAVPNGTEKGLYMAVDLGGTNFRVCSIKLHGNTTFSLTQSKVAIPRELMVAKTSKELFSFLAKQIAQFLETHHNEHYHSTVRRRTTVSSPDGFRDEEIFSLGFTFSFPVHQSGINKGTLIRWTKGFDIADAIGKDVCAMLQEEIDALNLPVRVAALVNDTVGTLMARSYTSPGKTGTLLGAIFGTGTNGAYVENLSKITKLKSGNEEATYDTSTGEMIVNTEWGSFDNSMTHLPTTPYDDALDRESVNPGIQMFEKRVSGMFLGEILRRALLSLIQQAHVGLFSDEDSSRNDIRSTTTIGHDSKLYQQWGLDTSFLSIAHGDHSAGLKVTRQTLDVTYGVSAPSAEDAEAVKAIASAIGRRAARLSAVAIGAVVLATEKLKYPEDIATVGDKQPEEDEIVDIGVDGSLVEFYPGFEDYVREALREIEGIGAWGEKRIRIGIAKDGSGVGAALIALVADRTAKGAVTKT
ncbi:hypothetical protein K461DRAFT_314856 [Myriangium duriaei CBS 260.36]|uniref:glucokinase n=1 Tax=Myriangium duriaei CBS 260.36 TaxID=1168546 RepID=A0A9P4ITJ6_9PEZI|nr:hypothetical protein K461DRAFT_314856 [Myriangium duriaei CBS 260.36]